MSRRRWALILLGLIFTLLILTLIIINNNTPTTTNGNNNAPSNPNTGNNNGNPNPTNGTDKPKGPLLVVPEIPFGTIGMIIALAASFGTFALLKKRH